MDELLLAVIAVLLAAVGYFIKRILDKTETIGDDVSDMKPKVEVLWKDRFAPAKSPRQLNERCSAILEGSGIKQVIESHRAKLLAVVRNKGVTNPYDAENNTLAAVMELPTHCPDEIENLKDGAFKVGADLNSVLFVGGIYLRNLIFGELGFSLDDLDKPKPNEERK